MILCIRQLIESLRNRSDVTVVELAESWCVQIVKGQKWICEVTIPHNVLEWFACVKSQSDKKEVWSDWMDYSSYDSKQHEELETEMAYDILAFIDHVSGETLALPLNIHQTKA